MISINELSRVLNSSEWRVKHKFVLNKSIEINMPYQEKIIFIRQDIDEHLTLTVWTKKNGTERELKYKTINGILRKIKKEL